ncbi:MAG: glycoside hydrolase family 2 protein, partial [Bacteroidales bacterium]|nr:glycoside hydrolase family 2 protein [Bacteroidales bacterium]
MVKISAILAFILSFNLTAQQLSWPEITKETKPWTRWWWPGSIVNRADITAAMEKYKEAGLGGLEITPIYGVKGQEDKFINFLSPQWMEMLIHTLNEAERLGLGIDMANASGWPFGGPWVEPEDACKNINYKVYKLRAGEKLSEKIEFIQQPLVRPVGLRPDIDKLKYPVSRNDSLQVYALDQLRYEISLPLHLLMAYSASGDAVNLTELVAEDKSLDWTPPEGEWTLYALFEGWHGK